MASMTHVSLSSSLHPTPSGSIPIRARITPEDDSSDFESDSRKTDDDSDSYASVIVGDGSESEEEFATGEEFASSEEFDTASERPFMGDPDGENPEEIGFVDKYPLLRPSAADPDEESLGNSFSEEEESDLVGDHHSPVVELARPIAQLSMDDEEFDELMGEERIPSDVEQGRFSGIVKVPSFGVLEIADSAPRVKLSDVEEDEGIELLVQGNPSGVEQAPVINDEGLGLNDFSASDNGFSGSKDQAIAGNPSSKDSVTVSVDPPSDDGQVVGLESYFQPLEDSKGGVEPENLEVVEDVSCNADDLVSVGVAKPEVHITAPEAHSESSEENRVIDLNCRDADKTHSMCCDPVDHVSEQSFAIQQKQKISERLDDTECADHAFETLITLADEIAETTAPELREPKFEGVGAEADESLIQSIAMENGRNNEKVEDDTGPENNIGLDLPESNDTIKAELIGATGFTNGLQTKNSSGNVGMRTSGGDGLAVAWQSNANSLHVSHEVNCDLEKIGAEKTELFDPAALAGLSEAATTTRLDVGNAMVNTADDPRVSSLEHPAGLTSLPGLMMPASASDEVKDTMQDSLGEEEKKMMKKIQNIRVKFLRLVHRLGCTPDEPIVAQVLHRLVLATGGCSNPEFSLESASKMTEMLEMEGKHNLDFSLNILVLGKTGVGKSATINSVFKEEKVVSNAFEPATTRVKEIVGTIDGVKIRMIDTPGLRSSVKEDATNRKILASIKRFMKKFPPDVVLYVDRLDTHTKDLNDLPLLRSVTNSLGASIWRNAIITLTHAASPLPDGPSGSPLNYELFVAQRSHIIQQAINQAVGSLRLMHPSMMLPVSLVENHPSSTKNKSGENVLPNGQSWRAQLLLLCYSLKILSEASSTSKSKDSFDQKKVFDFQIRSLPLPHLISPLLQSPTFPKVAADQGSNSVGQDSDEEGEQEQLPPFKSRRKSQLDKHSKDQNKAYFDEYDYRVRLFQKKQWSAELKTLKEIKQKGKVNGSNDYTYLKEDWEQEHVGPPTIPVPIPDLALPPSFDNDNISYGYRMLEPASQLLARSVLHSQGQDRYCGCDGPSLKGKIAIVGRFPGEFAAQITKDTKEFNIHLRSQFSMGRNSNMDIRVGMNNKRRGQIAVKTSSSEVQMGLIGIAPIVMSIIRRMYAGGATRNSDMPDF